MEEQRAVGQLGEGRRPCFKMTFCSWCWTHQLWGEIYSAANPWAQIHRNRCRASLSEQAMQEEEINLQEADQRGASPRSCGQMGYIHHISSHMEHGFSGVTKGHLCSWETVGWEAELLPAPTVVQRQGPMFSCDSRSDQRWLLLWRTLTLLWVNSPNFLSSDLVHIYNYSSSLTSLLLICEDTRPRYSSNKSCPATIDRTVLFPFVFTCLPW